MPQRGLEANRRLTKVFIDDDPHTIFLMRRIRINLPGKQFEYQSVPVESPQTVKFVYKGSASSFAGAEGLQVTGDGQETRFDFTIVALWNANIEEGDWFEDIQGQRWEVKKEIPTNDYERRYGVSAYGDKVVGG
jgi:hypothetical protein